MHHWWAYPPPRNGEFGKRKTAAGACYLDAATPVRAETGSVLFLELSGWAYDERTGSPRKDVAVEVSTSTQRPTLVRAERRKRPDLAARFANPRLVNGGFSATVLLPPSPERQYTVRVLPLSGDTVLECGPFSALAGN